MRPLRKQHLRAELIEILRECKEPQSVDQLVHQLFHRRARMSELLVLSGASIRRKKRLKQMIERVLDANFVCREVRDGEWRFRLAEAVGAGQLAVDGPGISHTLLVRLALAAAIAAVLVTGGIALLR